MPAKKVCSVLLFLFFVCACSAHAKKIISIDPFQVNKSVHEFVVASDFEPLWFDIVGCVSACEAKKKQE